MLTIQNTPNLAGISISGDYLDLDSLYMSLFTIVGKEGEYDIYKGARLRVLGIMYDIRHAFQGDREFDFVPNGMDAGRMKLIGMITPEKNLYYKTNVYYPEALFAVIALNDFILLYGKKRTKSASSSLLDKENLWDAHIASARLFQSLVIACLKESLTEPSFKRSMNLMHKDYTFTDRYTTQYLDMLNIRYLKMENREERAKNLSMIVKRIMEKGKEYREMELEVREMAIAHGCSAEDISLSWDYPEEIEW